MELTRHDRLKRLFKGETVDRPAIKLWSLYRGQPLLHPDYRPVMELGLQITELFDGGSCPFNCVLGYENNAIRHEHVRISDEWEHVISTLDTGSRILRQVNQCSLVGKPGYIREYFVKDEADLRAILDMPYKPYPADLKSYKKALTRVGDDGVAMFNIVHPAYALYELVGSELLAYMTVEARQLLEHAVDLFAARLQAHIKALADAGIVHTSDLLVFSWVGPELFIPPLLSPLEFDRFCFKPDKQLIDMIHDMGGYTWVHCHGKVRNFIDRFARMGCDMLNPIEPPPMGDVSLREAFDIADGRMALEGNIEIGEIMRSPRERIRELVDRALDECDERFVLGLSTGYMEVPIPPHCMIDNELEFLTYGYEQIVKRYSK